MLGYSRARSDFLAAMNGGASGGLHQAALRTLRPGTSALPLADAVMLRTGNASTTTAPWLVVVLLWRKSLRAFATRCCRYATPRIALRRLQLPWLAGAMRVPSLNVAKAAMPMSI